MTAAVLATETITFRQLRSLVVERGLKLEVGRRQEIVARWPVNVARLPHDDRRVVILRRNERDEWRGVILVGKGQAYDLVAQENHFRDLLHISLWLTMYSPQAPSPAPSGNYAEQNTTRVAALRFQ